MVQWLRLCASNAGATSSISSQRTEIPQKETTGPKRKESPWHTLAGTLEGRKSSLLPAPGAQVFLCSPKLGMDAQTPAVPRIPYRPGFCLAVGLSDFLPLPIISFLVTFGPSSHLSPLIHFYILFFYNFYILISTCICSWDISSKFNSSISELDLFVQWMYP